MTGQAAFDLKNNNLQARLNLIIETMPGYWEQKRYQHFTYHGPSHSERIHRQKLVQLAQELPEGQRLTTDEVFIVSAAAYLYEIGMQSPYLSPILNFEYQPGDTLSFAQLQQIREKKHLLSERLILDSVSNDDISRRVQLGFIRPADAYIPIIAEVVRWCSHEPLDKVPPTLSVSGLPVRIRLLVALLRLADQLYIDSSRVNLDLLQRAKLPMKQQAKWWMYHYTQVLPIANGQIPFYYFLPVTQKEYIVHIRGLIEPDFEFGNNPNIQYLWQEHQLRLIPHKTPTIQYDQPAGFQREMSREITVFLRQKVTPIETREPSSQRQDEPEDRSLLVVDYENLLLQLGQEGYFLTREDMSHLVVDLLREARDRYDGPVDALAVGQWSRPDLADDAQMLKERVYDLVEINTDDHFANRLGHELEQRLQTSKRPKRLILVAPHQKTAIQVRDLTDQRLPVVAWISNLPEADIFRAIVHDSKSLSQVLDLSDTISPAEVSHDFTNLRLDAAVSDQVYIERTFELAVSIRRSTSPLLSEQPLTTIRSGHLSVSQPARKSYTTLRIEVSAPECKIEGPDSYVIRLYHDEDPPVFYFHLTPRKLGEISIVVRVYQEEDWLGSTSVRTVVREEIVGSVTLTTTSEKLKSDTGEEMTKYLDFELHIDPHGHARVKSSEGERVMQIPTTVPDNIQLSLGLIEENQTNERLLKDLGKLLYGMAFPSVLDKHFSQTEAVSRYQGAKVRIRLTIEADSLAQLPWEFMYRAERGHYLGVDPNTVLSRYLNLPLPPNKVRRRQGPLHMLMIIADPSDQTRLDADEWETMILSALSAPIEKEQITTQTVKQATFKEITKALLVQQPDIIQFVGHGIYQDGKGYLALVDDNTGKSWIVDDERFAGIFRGHDDNLGLLSLATCESAKSDSPQGFLGIAPKIVRKGVPAVVAMQYPVLISSAKIFLENFYTAVAARKPVDWAVQHGRNSVGITLGYDNREFATPVLYMRAEDGNIF
jgi:hypothetical protein